ncbi:UDP-N-acetylmuramate--L-alanine ligase, partial [Candidatus Parcubacteria bacterium]|nr:UDP-N-acetylmuramate--L-alanine ligase [Candidatus Parcubacteria bacterium]
MTDKVLKKFGVKVIEKFDAVNIPKDADLIIYSSAYNADNNAEVAASLAGKKKVLTYASALAEVFNQRYGIAVVGSHGKTTTTAWLGYVMQQAGMEPNVMAGARVGQFGGCGITGKSDYMVIEADEYQNKLKHLQPKAALLNNIDYDHPDFFADKEEYEKVFIEFIKKIPKKGFLIANFDDPIIRKIVNVNCKGRVIGYAINEAADYIAYGIKQQAGKQYFKVRMEDSFFTEAIENEDDENIKIAPLSHKERSGRGAGGEGELGDFCIRLSGRHNVSNALAVIAACVELGVELVDIRKYMEEFSGAARRMQILGKFNGAVIIDDYAHHPTEIKATLAGAREIYPKNKLIVVFHPHTFTRTKALLDDFAKSFGLADEVIVLDIYGSAREKHGGVHSRDLVDLIKHENTKTRKHENTKTQKHLSAETLAEEDEN